MNPVIKSSLILFPCLISIGISFYYLSSINYDTCTVIEISNNTVIYVAENINCTGSIADINYNLYVSYPCWYNKYIVKANSTSNYINFDETGKIYSVTLMISILIMVLIVVVAVFYYGGSIIDRIYPNQYQTISDYHNNNI